MITGRKLSEETKRKISEKHKGLKASLETRKKISLGHLGIKHTEIAKMKIGRAHMGNKNAMWKGDNVSIRALHDWVKYHLQKTLLCQRCNLVPPYDLANISQEYKRDLSDWEWLCRKCHMTKDGRIKTFYLRRNGLI